MKKISILAIVILLLIILIGKMFYNNCKTFSYINLQNPNTYLNPIHDSKLNSDFKSDCLLIWCDEFEGNKLDKSFWSFQKGGNGWGNNELQFYTDRLENCYISNGKLIIKALKEDYQNNLYTSARIVTKGKIDFLYGKIEIKAKLPKGRGLFPAFWLLPSEDTYRNRKRNGEIDIMEMLGDNTNIIYGVAHYSYNKKYRSWGKYQNGKIDLSKDFHIYSLDWSPQKLQWIIDDTVYYSFDFKKHFDTDYKPYNKKFYLLINLAIGGDWPGNNIDDSIFPSLMEIEYIRYYQ